MCNARQPMQPQELCDAIEKLNLNQRQTADALDVDRTTIHRWQHGIRSIPGPAKKLVQTWLKWPHTLQK